MITTMASLPPPILQSFSSTLLTDYNFKKIEREKSKFDRIHRLAQKKLDERHAGKIKEFNRLRTLWEEEYERAKIKEEKYETAIKNAPQMPRISNEGRTCRFTRFQS